MPQSEFIETAASAMWLHEQEEKALNKK